jgi:acyl-CoA reductase-like NAD-dependent aldehyde dehydrogenase
MTAAFSVTNPYNNTVLNEYRYDSWEHVVNCINRLRQGQQVQKKLTAFSRADILRNLATLITEYADELALLVTRETGKTISDSRVEIVRATNTAIASSEESRQITGETLDSDAYPPARSRIGVVCWRPLGTVLCITPFNFPINIAIHKIGPAFAAGNCILFKPNPQNIASSRFLVDLCYRAGIPQDTLQLVMPAISDMPQVIAHADINAVNFTGGTEAAAAIAKAAGYKKLLFELGGNDALIVMADGDISSAVHAAINQRFATAGQRCTAAKRLFIHTSVYDEFRDSLLQATRCLKVGNPEDSDTFVGPVINSLAADALEQRITEALARGATLAQGGQREGNIIYPTILENVPDDCAVVRDETFGPVMPLRRFDDIAELIEVINGTPFGLQAGVFTNDMRLMRRLFEELEVGTLATNDGPGFRAEHFPFGGVKQSGIGREGVKYAIREMSFQKTLVL